MDTAHWRARFAALSPRAIDLSLDRMHQALSCLNHPEEKLGTLIHVAGTNGKGSVVAALETALTQAGQRVQSYTSPFLWDFRENIRLNGQDIDGQECAMYFAHLWDRCRHIPLTWFEADTLVAFLAFAHWRAPITILECGMGGAHDATAAAPAPTAAIVTNVARDHSEFLGDDLAQVAVEKAGIARGAPLYVPADFAFDIGRAGRLHTIALSTQHPSLALANGVLAAHFPHVPPLASLPDQRGRWQRCDRDPHLIYDVGHNAHAAAFLAARLSHEPAPYRLDLGMLRRKDPRAFLAAFQGLDLHLNPLDLGPEGHAPADLRAIAHQLHIPISTSAPYKTRLITGSHQTVAQHLKPQWA